MTPAFVRLCRALSSVAYLLSVLSLVGLGVLAVMLALSTLPELWTAGHITEGEAANLALWQRIGVWVVAAIGIAPITFAFWAMGRLFADFARGEVFTNTSATGIRRVGWLLIVGAALSVILGAARSVVLTATNPVGERSLAISFGSDQIILMMLGGFVVVIGHAMAEAARLNAENRSFI